MASLLYTLSLFTEGIDFGEADLRFLLTGAGRRLVICLRIQPTTASALLHCQILRKECVGPEDDGS